MVNYCIDNAHINAHKDCQYDQFEFIRNANNILVYYQKHYLTSLPLHCANVYSDICQRTDKAHQRSVNLDITTFLDQGENKFYYYAECGSKYMFLSCNVKDDLAVKIWCFKEYGLINCRFITDKVNELKELHSLILTVEHQSHFNANY